MHSLYQSDRPLVMGILNVTPDSFSDGGRFDQIEYALEQAQRMVEAGVDIIDVGGESTRPGAKEVTVAGELERVIPVIKAIAPLGKPISIDTSKADVMKAAVDAGAAMINDVRALQEPGALQVAAQCQVPVCLMHMQGQPRTMQQAPQYEQVVDDVSRFLKQRVEACEAAGISRDLICIDPGFGFGKTLEHNIELLRDLESLLTLDLPILAGISRKSMLGQITGKEVSERLAGSLAVALIAMLKSAKIIRVHDVAETVDVMKVFKTIYS
ncbi:dihydropteroate synthase [Pleionea sp. CnH1-48]|uniref:dihydropteroate synthase n=1 Tax=Pleionea sp. CnH1-48 TaxID=2954494 RepID=UPI002096FE82|nr:dihydropteroate synthase [Pleionea sp. CnH1-48]MCO7225084.1 dihydropteroate synthase [Pleionea sp. CnH1-48]